MSLDDKVPAEDPVASLIRAVARRLIDPSSGAMEDVEKAAIAAVDEPFRSDPALSAEILASTRQNVQHWVDSLIASPYTIVPPAMTPPVVGIAREGLRRGGERNLWASYDSGREVLWRHWMRLSFEEAGDGSALARALDVASASLSQWISETIRELTDQIERERSALTRGTHARKFEMVTLVLDGAPIEASRASDRLGYQLQGGQIGAVLWTDAGAPDQTSLSRVADEIRQRVESRDVLTIPASSSSLWLWLGGITPSLHPADLIPEQEFPHVRVAVGSAGTGVEGFRRSHFEAVEVQRLMLQAMNMRAATFDDVALVVLATRDENAARGFVARVLGPLAAADTEVRETLRIYIREGCSASRAAAALFSHRNTVVNRIQRAEALLPEPLRGRSVEVGAALEMNRWIGRDA